MAQILGKVADVLINIAIDGPSGSGKSTLAKLLAKRLCYLYMDTGALYRAVGLYMLRHFPDGWSEEILTDALENIQLSLEFSSGNQTVFLNGEDVTHDLRTQEVAMAASQVSAVPRVRIFLLDLQRNMARENNLIMDGRDIGTVVLPDAQVKIFLTASPEVRAQRRVAELNAKGIACDFDTVLTEILQRDRNDSTRMAAPLKKAEDAVLFDNSACDLDQTVERALAIIRSRLP